MSRDVHDLTLLEVSERLRRRELSSEAVTRTLLARIERLDGRLHAFTLVLGDTALDQARTADAELEAGLWRGPLHGVPLGIKDLLYTKGVPTMAGMPLLKDFRPDEDATVVRRLKRAGAVLIGKLHMTEGAFLHHHPDLPQPVNPWSEAHWTGVSSSGSGVAVTAGLCYGALGTDTGGSIRMPSAANNLTGVKPTWGRVSRHGLVPLAESVDHIGPMTRTAADAAAMLAVIAGPDPADPTALPDPVPDYLGQIGQGVSGLTVGVDWAYATAGLPAELDRALRQALEVLVALGMRLREVKLPTTAPFGLDLGGAAGAEVAAAHAAWFPVQADRYGPQLRAFLEAAQNLHPFAVVRGFQAREKFRTAMRAALREADVFLIPAFGRSLPTWDEIVALDPQAMHGELLRFTTPFNMAGVPTLSLPAGFTAQGVPIGVQLVARPLAEPVLLRAGHAFQQATDHHTRRPPLG